MKLAERLVIVTGASSGLGRAIALELASGERADVLLAARRRERLESLSEEIGRRGRRAWICEVDLAEPDGPRRLVAAAKEAAREHGARGGLPFGLVNNAGATYYGPATEMPADALRRVVDLNVAATMEMTRLFVAEHAADAGSSSGGRRDVDAAILTVTSLAAFTAVPYQAAYAASKHALHAVHESVFFELARVRRTGGPRIVTTEFAPGGIATEMTERSGLHHAFASRFLASPEKVARHAIRAWKRERRLALAGVGDRLTVIAARIFPRAVVGRVTERLYRP